MILVYMEGQGGDLCSFSEPQLCEVREHPEFSSTLVSSRLLLQNWRAGDHQPHEGFDKLHHQFPLLEAADKWKPRKGDGKVTGSHM